MNFKKVVNPKVFAEKWAAFHEGQPPATTKAFVSALANPDIKIEIEAWAAR